MRAIIISAERVLLASLARDAVHSGSLSLHFAPSAVRANPWDFMFDVHHNPCFRHSLLWGGGVGTTMAVHSAIRHRQKDRRTRTHTHQAPRRGEEKMIGRPRS